MFRVISHMFNLARTGLATARSGLITPALLAEMPTLARGFLRLIRLGARDENLVQTLQELGPSHIKLGQFLATRPDVIGQDMASQLSTLQDRLPPFDKALALAEIERGLGQPIDALFDKIGAPVAAASIAQVHKARIKSDDGTFKDVAVKVLRPGIEQRLGRDIDGFAFAASLIERLSKPARRLRPRAAVEMLAQSIKLELDLRLEAAALSELAQNTADDPGFHVPGIDWARTSRRVLTLDWVDGTQMGDLEALKEAGHDLPLLATILIQSFLRHAMRDGFFHADMHPGNLFVDKNGDIIAIDLGIMGRLEPKDRMFLAEILHGFITRDYGRVAQVHFNAGYVPKNQSRDVFAQALRAIGEPIMDQHAKDISMARLLAQLFQVTGQFDMEAQPQLMLLQKTMVVVEGVGRTLDPDLNIWKIAEPVVKQWMTAKLGPEGRLQDAADGITALGRLVTSLPETLEKFEHLAAGLENLPEGSNLAFMTPAERSKSYALPIWIGATALCAIAVALIF